MDNDIPTPAKGVYIFLDYVALGFVLTAIEELVRRGWDAWKTGVVCLLLGAAFLCMGIIGPRAKAAIASRLPWARLKRELAAALSQIEELKKNQRPSFWETITERRPSTTEPKGPDLKVEYRKVESERPRLVFKIRSGSPTTIRKVGPLVSEEAYRTEHDFVLLQEVIPEVEIDRPVECQISCLKNATSGDLLSVKDVLEGGGPAVSDSVLIEYTSDQHQFSRRFFLYKNADGSIVWSTENRQPAPRDLRVLRQRLHLLQSAPSDLTYAGELRLLMEQSMALEKTLLDVLASNSNPLLGLGTMDLSHPMKAALIGLDDSERDGTLPWQRLRLMSFRDRYQAHNGNCKKVRIPELPFVPNELDVIALCDAFEKQREAMEGIYGDIIKRYK